MVGWVVVRVSEGERAEQWRAVHNEVIPTAPLPLEEVLDRARTHVLEVALVDGVLVGCSTVRSATDEEPVTVIVRVLPAYRRKGLGTRYLAHAMTTARGLGAQRVQTIVLESNADGLAFAQRRGSSRQSATCSTGTRSPTSTSSARSRTVLPASGSACPGRGPGAGRRGWR